MTCCPRRSAYCKQPMNNLIFMRESQLPPRLTGTAFIATRFVHHSSHDTFGTTPIPSKKNQWGAPPPLSSENMTSLPSRQRIPSEAEKRTSGRLCEPSSRQSGAAALTSLSIPFAAADFCTTWSATSWEPFCLLGSRGCNQKISRGSCRLATARPLAPPPPRVAFTAPGWNTSTAGEPHDYRYRNRDADHHLGESGNPGEPQNLPLCHRERSARCRGAGAHCSSRLEFVWNKKADRCLARFPALAASEEIRRRPCNHQ